MKTITLERAIVDLGEIINYSLSSHDEINIASPQGSVVMLPEEDYEAMQETLRLLNDKKSLQALLESHKLRDEGKAPESYSIEEVFSDLQD